jgi:hypothetical protein
MKRTVSILLSAVCACAFVGCAEDRHDKAIAETISAMNGATTVIEQVTKTVGDAVADARKENKPLSVDKIKRADDETKQLKEKSKILQEIKGYMEVNKENITKEQREDYEKKYKGALREAATKLDAAQKKLEATLQDAEKITKDHQDSTGKKALETLRKTLQDHQEDFTVLTKRQA